MSVFLLLSTNNVTANHEHSLSRSKITIDFDRKLGKIIYLLKENPNISIIIISNNSIDYESIFSLNRFFYSYDIPNKIGLHINRSQFDLNDNDSSQTKWLKMALTEISKDGANPKRKDLYLDPIDTLDKFNCISISLSGDTPQYCSFGNIRLWN